MNEKPKESDGLYYWYPRRSTGFHQQIVEAVGDIMKTIDKFYGLNPDESTT